MLLAGPSWAAVSFITHTRELWSAIIPVRPFLAGPMFVHSHQRILAVQSTGYCIGVSPAERRHTSASDAPDSTCRSAYVIYLSVGRDGRKSATGPGTSSTRRKPQSRSPVVTSCRSTGHGAGRRSTRKDGGPSHRQCRRTHAVGLRKSSPPAESREPMPQMASSRPVLR